MKAVVAAFNQEKALVGAFSVITNLRMELFEALAVMCNVIKVAGLQKQIKQGIFNGCDPRVPRLNPL